MAERSTAAVGVAETSGEEEPLTTRNDEANADSATDGHSDGSGQSPAESRKRAEKATSRTETTHDGEHTDHGSAVHTEGAEDRGSRGEDTKKGMPAASDDERGADSAKQETALLDPVTARTAPMPPVTSDTAPLDPVTEDGVTRTDAQDTAILSGESEAHTSAEPPRAEEAGAAAEHRQATARTEILPEAQAQAGTDESTATAAGTAPGTASAVGAPSTAGSEAEAESKKPKAAKPKGKAKDQGKPAKPGKAASTEPLSARELHSGHKLARRYRLEECVTRLDGFSSWRAVDEKLRRAVGVHVLPSGHPHARPVLSAARSSALLGDPRFVQVLDAVEDHDLVYVVHEWLPDATPLSALLASGPLPAHDAYQLVTQLSQALTAAHREGLAHLRLTPGTVLRTGSGQYRIRGLAVNAALRGISSDTPQRDDTEAIGALLYAALTQRWPYEEDAYGLTGVGPLAKGSLVAPDQVRAGVHRGLSQLAMRALVNDGATASSQEQPCATPEELAKAASALPRIRPPETSFNSPRPYQRTTYQQGGYGNGAPAGPAAGGRPVQAADPPAPPALPGRTGKALKWGVSALLIVALGLGSWQLADTLLKGDSSPGAEAGGADAHGTSQSATGSALKIAAAKDFDPPPGGNGSENPSDVPDAVDGNPATYWLTQKYYGRPDFGNLKPGVGLVLDLGKVKHVSAVKADFMGQTSADFMAAPKNATAMPSSLSGFQKVTGGTGEHLNMKAKKPVATRYVLVWLTKLPLSDGSDYRGRVTEVKALG